MNQVRAAGAAAARGAQCAGQAGARRAPHRLQPSRGLHKNKFVEEWNSHKEDAHKRFTFDGPTATRVIGLGVVTPVLLYLFVRNEEVQRSRTGENFNGKQNKYF